MASTQSKPRKGRGKRVRTDYTEADGGVGTNQVRYRDLKPYQLNTNYFDPLSLDTV
jgi:hypothetical protein